MVYRCVGSAYQDAGGEELRKKCPAKMEMRILTSAELEKNGKSKQYPCLVHISFYHNHTLSTSINGGTLQSSVAAAEFKVQELHQQHAAAAAAAAASSALKDQYEYFMPNNNLGDAHETETTQAVSLSAIQPQHQPQTVTLQILPAPPSSSYQFDLDDVSRKLDEALDILRTMLNKSGSSCAAVKQFTDRFDDLKNIGDDEALEDALCSFGAEQAASAAAAASGATTTILGGPPVHLAPVTQPSTASLVQTASEQLTAAPTSLTATPVTLTAPATLTTPQWSMTPVMQQHPLLPTHPTTAAADEGDDGHLTGVSAAVSDAVARTLKKLKKRRKTKTNSTVLPGQIDPVTGKRRKRSRCGTCLGCINRDKTQDCRVCRNCLDQKRYGGPGRLKKACVRRSCAIMMTTEGLEPMGPKQSSSVATPTSAPSAGTASQLLGGTTIALPMHPLPVGTSVDAVTSGATITLPQTPVTLTARTTTGIGSQMTSTSPASVMAVTSETVASTPSATAILTWPNGRQFPPTFEVSRKRTTFDLTAKTTPNPDHIFGRPPFSVRVDVRKNEIVPIRWMQSILSRLLPLLSSLGPNQICNFLPAATTYPVYLRAPGDHGRRRLRAHLCGDGRHKRGSKLCGGHGCDGRHGLADVGRHARGPVCGFVCRRRCRGGGHHDTAGRHCVCGCHAPRDQLAAPQQR
jgi:hypothetical protein